MDQVLKNMISEEMEQYDCSILLDECRERVQKLREMGIRETDIVSQVFCSQLQPQKLVIRDDKIFLGDDQREIHMEPIVRAVYLLFLKHPEGIKFKNLPDYRQELAEIYNKVRPWGLTDRAIRSIEDVTNPLLNSINEKCSRIRRAFLTHLDSNLAKQYYIRGKRGTSKRITLSRELVIYETPF